MRKDRVVVPAGERPIADFLASLAAREPAPGGGAAPAFSAAQGAALVAMVARYSDRGDDPGAVALAERIAVDADALRTRAIDLIQGDIDAFAAVAEAYRLPKETDREKAARKDTIATASIGAAQMPADVIAVARDVVQLCGELLPVANRNVITDVAAAADAARAAAGTARLNVEINLGSITDEGAQAAFSTSVAGVDELLVRADAISAEVRAGL
jgi:formiminotetrahydrofolate cyclodeaminase